MEGDIGACPVVRSPAMCHWKEMWQKMNEMRKLGQLCDMCLVTNDYRKFPAHSNVLAACSESLYTFLMERSTESCNRASFPELYVLELDAGVMQITLDFIYGVIPSDKVEFELLIQGAKHFGLKNAEKFCLKRLEQLSIGNSNHAPKVNCPLKNPDIMSQILNKTNTDTEGTKNKSSDLKQPKPPKSTCPFSGMSDTMSLDDNKEIADMTAKFIGEVLARHYAKHNKSSPSVTEELKGDKVAQCGNKNVSDESSELSHNQHSHSEPPSQHNTPRHSGQGKCSQDRNPRDQCSQDYQLPTELSTGLGASGEMPMDIHHSLIPEMTLNDLTRLPECPHLKRLAAESGLSLFTDNMYDECVGQSSQQTPADSDAGNSQLSCVTGNYDNFPDVNLLENGSDPSPTLSASNDHCVKVQSFSNESVLLLDKTLHCEQIQLQTCNESKETPRGIEVVLPNILPVNGYESVESGPTDCEDLHSHDAEETSLSDSAQKNGLKPHKCDECDEELSSPAQLRKHCLKVHGKGRLFACTDCNFKSPRKKDVQAHTLAKHKKIPAGLKVFHCDLCDYVCMDKHRFSEHKDSHSGTARFKCSQCTKSYTTRRGLQTHLQYHSQDRPHRCDKCDACFKVKDKLRDHLRLIHTHPGLKPYQCGYCKHASALRGNCNQHIRRSHPGKPILVIDITEKQNKNTPRNDYSEIAGQDVEVCHDLSKMLDKRNNCA